MRLLPPPARRVRRHSSRPAARDRVRTPGRRGPGLPRLHGRGPVRGVAALRPSRAAPQRRARQPALHQPDLGGVDRAARARTRRRCCATSTRRAEYRVVFTPNATGALKLVGEAYPFDAGSRFLLTSDNHNSVNGIREFARAAGATTTYLPGDAAVAARRRATSSRPACARRTAGGTTCSPTRPSRTSRASSIRSSGSRRHRRPAGTCSSTARRSCRRTGSTSASGSRTSSPSRSTRCSATRPASAACSFASEALARLRRPWFAGGTIATVCVQGDWHALADGEAGVRGRHGQLPLTAGRRAGASLPRGNRHRHDPHPRRAA